MLLNFYSFYTFKPVFHFVFNEHVGFRRYLPNQASLSTSVQRQYSGKIQSTYTTVASLFKTPCTRFYQNPPSFTEDDINILDYSLLEHKNEILTNHDVKVSQDIVQKLFS